MYHRLMTVGNNNKIFMFSVSTTLSQELKRAPGAMCSIALRPSAEVRHVPAEATIAICFGTSDSNIQEAFENELAAGEAKFE
jgi:hypothetical protein